MERERDRQIKHLHESNTISTPPPTLKQKNMYTKAVGRVKFLHPFTVLQRMFKANLQGFRMYLRGTLHILKQN
jgi:hypothetical protein